MWRILLRQIDAQPVAATKIVKSITVLHNFIVENEPHRLVTTAQDVQQDQRTCKLSKSSKKMATRHKICTANKRTIYAVLPIRCWLSAVAK
ncbi:hypothetical protein PoB_004304600 [Plakobranchus ocellatus]|uniref:ENTH domain-containing protein n=1 Tax=Plakobranchus ocellatus TaxID=259542 RepID=A0AAV4AZG1_9GAST|nr:hypothetical protein PoB_004304600 [Plakobranchus ocellatus]